MKLKRPIKSISGTKVRVNALEIHYYLCPLILIFVCFPIAIISGNSIKEFSDLGILWHEDKNYERLNAYGNLLKNYADDSGTIYYKIRELASKKVLVKDMERVYENGGELKTTMNVIEKTEDGGSVIRWLEEGLTEAEAKALGKTPAGWKHIWEKHRIDFANKFGITTEEGIQNYIYDSIKYGIKEKIPTELGGGFKYIYEPQAGKKMFTIVGDNGYIVTASPLR